MHRADPRAGQHRDRRFGDHRHVQGDARALHGAGVPSGRWRNGTPRHGDRGRSAFGVPRTVRRVPRRSRPGRRVRPDAGRGNWRRRSACRRRTSAPGNRLRRSCCRSAMVGAAIQSSRCRGIQPEARRFRQGCSIKRSIIARLDAGLRCPCRHCNHVAAHLDLPILTPIHNVRGGAQVDGAARIARDDGCVEQVLRARGDRYAVADGHSRDRVEHRRGGAGSRVCRSSSYCAPT